MTFCLSAIAVKINVTSTSTNTGTCTYTSKRRRGLILQNKQKFTEKMSGMIFAVYYDTPNFFVRHHSK